MDFIAELTQHIPDPRKHLVRYLGFYSNKSRGMRAKAAGDAAHDDQTPAVQTTELDTHFSSTHPR